MEKLQKNQESMQKILQRRCLPPLSELNLTQTGMGRKGRHIQSQYYIFKTINICQSAEGNKDGLWTTVVASAILLP